MLEKTLSQKENIHFSKYTEGFKEYIKILEIILENINLEISINKNSSCLIELNRFKSQLEKDIKGQKKRIEMIR